MDDISFKNIIFDFIRQFEWGDVIAVTLTMKKKSEGQWLDEIKASQNLRHFLNRLNCAVYGNSFRRHGKRLKVFPVIENDTRLHYHLILECPRVEPVTSFSDLKTKGREFFRFRRLIQDCWRKTQFGYHQICFHESPTEGWVEYLLKGRTKYDYLRSIDWENAVLPSQTS